MTHPGPRLLADDLARSLSDNALRHLRAARIARHAELTSPPEALRALLLSRGLPAYEPLIDLEARAGGAALPGGRLLGAACFLRASPSLRLRDLPSAEGQAAFPVYGIPEHLAEWESPFGLVSASGSIAMFDAPHGPAPAFSSLEHLLEIAALAPLSDRLHALRVDAFCGEMLAGLLDAYPHPPATGAHAAAWVGDGLWVKELRIDLPDDRAWSSWRGTFACTEQAERLVDVIALLLEHGYSLGHQGPVSAPPPGQEPLLSFVDEHPELGHRAAVRVSAWRGDGGVTFSRQVEAAR